MTLLRLAGFSSVRVTSQWLPGSRPRRRETELATLRNVAAAAQLSGVRVYLSVYPPGSQDDTADPGGASAVRRLRDGARAAAAVDRRRDHRQRAEPQPLLAAAVQPGRHRRRRARVPGAARAHLRRDQGRRPDSPRLGWRARTSRRRPAGHGPRHALADRVPQGHGHRVPRERPDAADHGRARIPPVRRHLGQSPDTPHPKLDHDRPRRLRPADPDASRPRSTGLAAGRLAAPDPLRRVRRRVDDPAGQGESRTRVPSRRRRSRSTRPRRARTTPRRCSSRSASRT